MNRTLYVGWNAVEAPVHLKRTLLMRGGSNPYGEPMFRLVRTEGRKRLSTGLWSTYAEGTSTKDRNPDLVAPWRRQVETRAVPLYPNEHGWVLECWQPAISFGTPELWYSPKARGGTILHIDGENYASQGDYPWRGDYMATIYVFATCRQDGECVKARLTEQAKKEPWRATEIPVEPFGDLSVSLVLTAIGRILHSRDNRLASEEARVQASIEQAMDDQKKGEAYQDKRDAEVLGENVYDHWSLGARAEVNKLAESIGIKAEVY